MASKLSGVGVHTIRAWEKRYKALEPSRDSSGHRTYSKTDIEKLMLLSELCLLGYTISKVAKLTILELKELLKDLGKSEESLVQSDFNLVSEAKVHVDPSQSMPIINFALRSYKLDVVSLELGKLKSLVSNRDFALSIMLPLIQTLREAEASGTLTSVQCEAVIVLLKFHMGHGLYHVSDKKEKGSVNLLIAGMQGDSEDLLLSLVGLLANHYGVHYTYIGPDVSGEALVDLSRSLEANTIVLGPTNAFIRLGKGPFQNYIEKLLGKISPQTELVIAGKSELEFDKMTSKKLIILKSIEAIDEYLSKKAL